MPGSQPGNPSRAEAPLVRKATLADAPVIAQFNRAMARETEGKGLLPHVIGAGVQRLLEDASLGFYVVAEHGGEIIGALLVTQEWSDWRNGRFWWIQSVYVTAPWRRRGVYRDLYAFVRRHAQDDPNVCGFRLYVEKDNVVAQQTYESLGMVQTDYKIYEELKPGVVYLEKD